VRCVGAGVALAILVGLGLTGCKAKPHAAPDATAVAPPANPIQAEMRLLTAAMETAVRGVGTGDVSEVAHALHGVHAAKAASEAAIEAGTWRPPLHGDRLTDFAALDEAFHARLERMVVASEAKDVQATAAALGEAMAACQGCHAAFRR